MTDPMNFILPSIISAFIIILFLPMSTSLSSFAEDTSVPYFNFTHFFGCKRSSNYQCELMSSDTKGYSLPGTATDKLQVLREPDYVHGSEGEAVLLQAKNFEAITVDDNPGINSFNFSISFWIKTSGSTQPYSHVISHVDRSGTAGWYFDMFSNKTGSYLTLSLTSTDGKLVASPAIPVQDDAFSNIVGTFNGSEIKVYKDGQVFGSTKYNGSFWPYPLTPLTFGSASYGYAQLGWSGIIDGISIYNRTLDSSEITKPSASTAYTDKDLVGQWFLDGNLSDQSQYRNNGKMHTLVTSISFSPDGKLFFVEKNTGNVMIKQKNKANSSLFVHIPDSYVSWEQGLLGLAIDPLYEQNHFVYLYYTVNDISSNGTFNRVVRFTDSDNKATDEKILIDRIPASKGYHSGGAIAFGPDDKLYITVGDATEHIFAQDPSINVGKILRINRDGSIPTDNPYPNSPVYTIGHRNMFGIAFDKRDGIGIATENGDYRYDEVNVIQKGGNYGFPTMQPPNISPELANDSSIKPVRSYGVTIGPTQAIFYDMKKISELANRFLFGTYTGSIYSLALNSSDLKVSEEDIINFRFYPFEPVIAITSSPEGDIYFGGYNIYKLQIPNGAKKTQLLYPIRILSSENNLVEKIVFDEMSNQVIVNFTGIESDNNSNPHMRVEIPRNLLNVTKIQLVYDNGSAVTDSLDAAFFEEVQAKQSGELNIVDVTVLPKFARLILKG